MASQVEPKHKDTVVATGFAPCRAEVVKLTRRHGLRVPRAAWETGREAERRKNQTQRRKGNAEILSRSCFSGALSEVEELGVLELGCGRSDAALGAAGRGRVRIDGGTGGAGEGGESTW